MATPLFGMVRVKVGEIPIAKLKKAFNGNNIRLTNADLSGDRVMLLHPHTAKLIDNAKRMGKGINIAITPAEAIADIAYHKHVGEGMHGGSLWSWLKDKAWPWVKKNWGVIKPVVSKIADVAIPAAVTALGSPELSGVARNTVKSLTGVGLKKGSPEMKEHMRKLREMRSKRKSKRKGSEESLEAGSHMVGSSFSMP